MKSQCAGKGHGSRSEDWLRDHPKAKRSDIMPPEWRFTKERVDNI
jgi:hypothetical protein